MLRVYECLEIYNASSWQLTEELDVMSFGGITPSLTPAVPTPGIENNSPTSSEGLTRRPSTPSINQASKLAASASTREAESGWCLSWCKEKWWGEIVAVSAGTSACVKVRRWTIASIFAQNTYMLMRLRNQCLIGHRCTTGSQSTCPPGIVRSSSARKSPTAVHHLDILGSHVRAVISPPSNGE